MFHLDFFLYMALFFPQSHYKRSKIKKKSSNYSAKKFVSEQILDASRDSLINRTKGPPFIFFTFQGPKRRGVRPHRRFCGVYFYATVEVGVSLELLGGEDQKKKFHCLTMMAIPFKSEETLAAVGEVFGTLSVEVSEICIFSIGHPKTLLATWIIFV